jgi:hypothetical protein
LAWRTVWRAAFRNGSATRKSACLQNGAVW